MANLPATKSNSHPISSNDVAEVLASATAKLVYECGLPVLLEPLDAGQRRALERRAEALAMVTAPMRGDAQTARARSALAALFGSIATLSGRDAAAMVGAYMVALADLPAWAVEAACMRAVRGGVAGLNPDFAPTAARLHGLAREAMADATAERVKISEVLRARIEPPADPAMRERVGQLFAVLVAELKAWGEDNRDDIREAAAERSIARNLEGVKRMRLAAGLPDVAPDEPVISPALIEAVRNAG